jgi:hypothetical protein
MPYSPASNLDSVASQASPVSHIGFRIFWKPPTLPGFSRYTKRLSSTARCEFRSGSQIFIKVSGRKLAISEFLAWRLGSNYRRPVRNLIISSKRQFAVEPTTSSRA